MDADSIPDEANCFLLICNMAWLAYLRCIRQGGCVFLRLKRVLS